MSDFKFEASRAALRERDSTLLLMDIFTTSISTSSTSPLLRLASLKPLASIYIEATTS